MERKLSNKDKAESYYMRLEGYTLQEIADKFGVTKQSICNSLPSGAVRQYRSNKKSIYPALSIWMFSNGISAKSFAGLVGVSYSTILKILDGVQTPGKDTIDEILKATGLKYEEAFSTEETENG